MVPNSFVFLSLDKIGVDVKDQSADFYLFSPGYGM